MRFQKTISVGVALALWPIATFAQSVAKPDPADAAASVPAPHYDSAFSGYVAFQESQLGAWRELNDELGRVGGHAGHLKNTSESNLPAKPKMPRGMTDHGAHHSK